MLSLMLRVGTSDIGECLEERPIQDGRSHFRKRMSIKTTRQLERFFQKKGKMFSPRVYTKANGWSAKIFERFEQTPAC